MTCFKNRKGSSDPNEIISAREEASSYNNALSFLGLQPFSALRLQSIMFKDPNAVCRNWLMQGVVGSGSNNDFFKSHWNEMM